jgi:hypothetical protein
VSLIVFKTKFNYLYLLFTNFFDPSFNITYLNYNEALFYPVIPNTYLGII